MTCCELNRDLRNRTDCVHDSGRNSRQITFRQTGQAAPSQAAHDQRHYCRRWWGRLLHGRVGICITFMACTEPELNERWTE